MVHVFLTSTQTSHLKVFYFLFLQYGRAALEAVMKSVLGFDAPLVPIPKTYDGDFFEGSYLKIENLFFYSLASCRILCIISYRVIACVALNTFQRLQVRETWRDTHCL